MPHMNNRVCEVCGPPCGRLQRRTFLADMGMGFTGLALGAMLKRDGIVRFPKPRVISIDPAPPAPSPVAPSADSHQGRTDGAG